MTLTFDQVRKYFEHRHPGQKIGTRNKVSVKCAFHDDKTPSCTLFLDGAGGFHCNGCGVGGNVFQFEARFSGCTVSEAEGKVAEITGARADKAFGSFSKLGVPVAAYDYRDDDDRVIYQKRRYQPEGEPKTFRVFRPGDTGNWIAGIDPPDGPSAKRVLYNQPRLVTANVVLICEGEKDADNVSQLNIFADRNFRVATTCNFDGAWKPGEKSKWLTSYNPYFAGKFVVIFEDNDDSGRSWAAGVGAAIYPYAHKVKVLRLPGLPPKGDVSDWLQTHTVRDLEEEIAKAPAWKPEVAENKLLVSAPDFVNQAPREIEWLIDGVIERGANGFFVAAPKGGKSWAAIDMILSLALGVPWMDMEVPRPVRCALISREDNPRTTSWRLAHLFAGKKTTNPGLLEHNLYINSRAQSPELMLDNPQQLTELVDALKDRRVEFAIFDVFNVLHACDENDNTEMRAVLRQLSTIQSEVGCSIGVVHHFNKADTGALTQRMRGASAIAGWAEWLIGITKADDATKVRRMEFELKAAQPPDPIYYKIESNMETGICRLARTALEAHAQHPSANRASLLMQTTRTH